MSSGPPESGGPRRDPAESESYSPRRHEIADTVRRVEEEVIRRLRNRGWVLVVVFSLLGYFGLKEIVRGVTDTDTRAAQRAAIVAEESAKKATAATEEATRQAEGYSKTVGGLQAEAVKVQQQFLVVKNQIEADRANLKASAEKNDQELRARIARLDELVAKLAQESRASRQALETYQRDLQKLTAAAEADRKRFTENSRYAVAIYSTAPTRGLAHRAQQSLSAVGFRASVTDLAVVESTAVTTLPFTVPMILPERPDPTRYKVNTIVHSSGRVAIANEVKDVLAPVAKIKALIERPWKADTTTGVYAILAASIEQVISVYLVEKG